MTHFGRWPLRRKLMALLLLTSTVVLLVTSASFVAYETVTFRRTALANLSALADIIASNSTASLAFANTADGTEVLSALRAKPEIVAAALYDARGRLFVRYPAGQSAAPLPATPGLDGFALTSSRLVGFRPVLQGSNKRLGTLYIEADTREISDRLRLYGVLAAAVMAVSLLAAYLVAAALQGQISEPILALAGAAKAVAERHDYSVRAPRGGEAEIGLLTDAFNQMLSQIELQDTTVRESRERLDLALSSARIGAWDWIIAQDVVSWDTLMHEHFGLAPGTFAGNIAGFEALVHPDDRARVGAQVQATIDRDVPFDSEYRVVWANATLHAIAARGRVYRDGAGAAVRMAGVCWDVTEKRRAEEQRHQLATIVESADDAIISNAMDGTIRSWNPGATRLFGYQAEEILGHPLRQLIPPERWPEELEVGERLKRGEHVRLFESEWRAKDGRPIPVSLTSSLIVGDDGSVAGASQIVRDIADQKRSEQRQQRLIVELERSNKELEQFGYVASHDLQEPLRMVSSYTQLLARRYGALLDDDARQFIEYAVDGARRMQGLINALLDYSRVGTRGKDMQPVDLNQMLGMARANLAVAIEEAGAIVSNDELPTVRADQTQMVQLFQNLIGNAIKFRADGAPHVHIGAREEPAEWVVSVKDNGIGIDPQYADRIFVIFQRLHSKEEYPGTGIGLSVCKRIVERHGGVIRVTSGLGEGSTFSFNFPKNGGAPLR